MLDIIFCTNSGCVKCMSCLRYYSSDLLGFVGHRSVSYFEPEFNVLFGFYCEYFILKLSVGIE